MTVVEARFAGGPIIVEQGTWDLDPTRGLVTFTAPSFVTKLFIHEARDLGQALIDVADAAEHPPAPLRRLRAVDEHLQVLDD